MKETNRTAVWMFHPWSRSIICYDCYTYEKNDFNKFDCRSGPKNPVDCGPSPLVLDDTPVTITEHVTSTITSPTFTVSPTTTTTVSTTLGGSGAQDSIEKRKSWRRRVEFNHPFITNTRVCGEAEWEKRGQPLAEVRLQKIGTNMKKCDGRGQLQRLDLPQPSLVTVSHSITTAGIVVKPTTTTTTITVPVNVVDRDTSDDEAAAAFDGVPPHKDL